VGSQGGERRWHLCALRLRVCQFDGCERGLRLYSHGFSGATRRLAICTSVGFALYGVGIAYGALQPATALEGIGRLVAGVQALSADNLT
jgi:hypothetical protein